MMRGIMGMPLPSSFPVCNIHVSASWLTQSTDKSAPSQT